MQEIPDTGGGLSGFIAWLLWQVYQYFPFEGTWDWLLLIIFLAILVRCIMIPVWWRILRILGQSKPEPVAQIEEPDHKPLPTRQDVMGMVVLCDLFWPWLVICLFNTEAGRTFLEGRSGQSLDAVLSLYFVPLVYHVIAAFVAFCLFGTSSSNSFREMACGLLGAHSFIALLATLLCAPLSVASVVVLLVFSVTVVLPLAVLAWLRYHFPI